MRPNVKLASVVLFVWLSITVALLGCDKSPADDEPLLGTWVLDPGVFVGTTHRTYTYLSDGTCLGYLADATEPSGECRYTIEEKRTDDAGNVYYHSAEEWSPVPFDESSVVNWYLAARVDSTGDLLEAVWSQEGYAEEVSPAARGIYGEYRRQP